MNEPKKDFLEWLITDDSYYSEIAGLSITKTRNNMGELVVEIVVPKIMEDAVKSEEKL